MTKLLKISLLLILVLTGTTNNSCEEEEQYDMFSYKVGNEYYYKYRIAKTGYIPDIIDGYEKWTVLSMSSSMDSDLFVIERKLNGARYFMHCTTIISDSIRFINAIEYKNTSEFTLLGFKILRYQKEPEIEVERRGDYNLKVYWRCTFKADSGLTKYYYYHPPNHIVNEWLTLDSIKVYN